MSTTTGTITVTNGSPTVTGAGTGFRTEYVSPDDILIVDGTSSAVKEVVSETEIRLQTPCTGGSGSNKPYSIVTTNGAKAVTQLATKVAELVISTEG